MKNHRYYLGCCASLLLACSGGTKNPGSVTDSGVVTTTPPTTLTPTSDAGIESGVASWPGPDPTSGIPARDCKTAFSYTPGHSVGKVELAGQWDAFAGRITLTDPLGTGTYRVETKLNPGSYGYKFVVDDTNWVFDPNQPETMWIAGSENSRVRVADCRNPYLKVTSNGATPAGEVTLAIQYVDGVEQKGPDASSLTASQNGISLPASAYAFDAKTGLLQLHVSGLAPDKYTFQFGIKNADGRAADPLLVPMWVESTPYQWGDGPMYFVFTDRFRDGDPSNDVPVSGVDTRANYQGGDYKGVIAALKEGYFDALGVRAIWVSPPNDNTDKSGAGASDGRPYSAYHGYWVTKARALEEHWGALDDLKALTHEAHQHGIRILLDWVGNQLHQEHEYYIAHKSDGWFNGDGSCVCGAPGCDWDVHRIDCWFTSYLPDVNYKNVATTDQMTADALWWLVNSDADGLRVDAVKHMDDCATTTLRAQIKSTLETGNVKYWTVGETFTGDRGLISNYIGPNRLGGQFDFPIYFAVDSAFSGMGGTMSDLDGAVTGSESGYPAGAIMSPFIGNQDVPRFISRAAGMIASDASGQAWSAPPPSPSTDDPYDKTFLALTFVLTQRGVPLIYYGDEIGTPGTADPDNRRMMKWSGLSSREQHLLDRVKVVAKARGSHPGLMRGARRTLYTDGDGYVYARGAAIDLAVVALNRGSTNRSVHVTLPPELGVPDGTTLKDLLGGPSVTASGGAIDVPLTTRGAQLFVR